MRKAVFVGFAALALVAALFGFAPAARSQGRPTPEVRAESRVRLLDGRGSSIGVHIRDADREGVRIDEVEEGSPAAKAGLKPGDVVVEFDGERVRSARQFSRLVQETPEGRTVRTTIVRDGSRQTLEIAPDARARVWDGDVLMRLPDIEREVERGLRAMPRHFAFDFNWDAEHPGLTMWPRGRLGAQLTPLTSQLAEYFGASEGVLVASVDEDSAGAKAGLKAGDVITAVNGRPVDSPRAVSAEIQNAGPGSTMEIRVLRDRKELALTVQIPERRPTPRRSRPA